jgi:hypothetical protein
MCLDSQKKSPRSPKTSSIHDVEPAIPQKLEDGPEPDGRTQGPSDPHFIVHHRDYSEFTLITRSSAGKLKFLVNKLQKMNRHTALGTSPELQ